MGCGEGGDFIPCRQLSCNMACLWNSTAVEQLHTVTAQLLNSKAAEQHRQAAALRHEVVLV